MRANANSPFHVVRRCLGARPWEASVKKAKRSAKKKIGKRSNDAALREQLVALLSGGHAHAKFADAITDFPAEKRGMLAENLPYTAWQLLEHLRIAQWDILEFSRNSKHESPKWPDDYWPKSAAPADAATWDKSVAGFEKNLGEMIILVKNPKSDLYAKIPHGDGQTILREALLLADHNSYHLGQLVLVRKALGAWAKA